MKTINYFGLRILTIVLLISSYNAYSQDETASFPELLGNWRIDMTPENKTDTNFAMMRIDKIENNFVEGDFYREGVAIQEGRTNTQFNRLYVALISGDNSGQYNTTFYYENGKIYGTTHSIDRDFLAVWEGEKQ